jgi:GxxExxY protein
MGNGRSESWSPTKVNAITEKIIGCAIEVHRTLGPGLLESAYEACLCHELSALGLQFRQQQPLPVAYKSVTLDCGYRLDLVVEDTILVELKSVDKLLPLHEAQLMTYLRLTDLPVGLLINFNVLMLKQGIKRMAHTLVPGAIRARSSISSPKRPL